MVKMKACKNATSNSSTLMNNANGTATAAPPKPPPKFSPAFPNTKMRPTKLIIMICPAVIPFSVIGLQKTLSP